VTFTSRAAVVWGLGDYDKPDLQMNGVDDYGVEWVLGPVEGWKRTAVSNPIVEGGMDGGWFEPGRRLPKTMTLAGAFRQCRGGVDLDAAEERLRSALEITDRSTWLWHAGPVPKQMGIKLTGELIVAEPRKNRGVRTWSAVVTAADPLKYAAGAAGLISVSTGLSQIAPAGITFPIQFPADFGGGDFTQGRLQLDNPGTQPVAPIITFEAKTSTLEYPVMRHLGLGEFSGVNRIMLANDTAVADHDPRAPSLRLNESSIYGDRLPGSTFFPITKGRNDLLFTANTYSAVARATVSFRPAWS
jgi:hypothetical protein